MEGLTRTEPAGSRACSAGPGPYLPIGISWKSAEFRSESLTCHIAGHGPPRSLTSTGCGAAPTADHPRQEALYIERRKRLEPRLEPGVGWESDALPTELRDGQTEFWIITEQSALHSHHAHSKYLSFDLQDAIEYCSHSAISHRKIKTIHFISHKPERRGDCNAAICVTPNFNWKFGGPALREFNAENSENRPRCIQLDKERMPRYTIHFFKILWKMDTLIGMDSITDICKYHSCALWP